VSSQYLSEIRIMGFGFAPRGWAFCNGQTLSTQQNNALFALCGTTYGGNGTTNFALPNLQGQVPLHMDTSFVLGQASGEGTHTLIVPEMAAHNHLVTAKNATATTGEAAQTVVLAQGVTSDSSKTPVSLYGSLPVNTSAAFATDAISATGNNQPHPNMQPYLVLNFCIALSGIYPSRN
jgi:microcystin-dependent protein